MRLQKSDRKHSPTAIAMAVRSWIINNTTPSSNTMNVIRVRERGLIYDHVVHWRTDTLQDMFDSCILALFPELGVAFSKSFFFRCIPAYVKLKRRQDGLCPYHHTGITLQRELLAKRGKWHTNCTCQCLFCSPNGCNHGKDPLEGQCSLFTCTRCTNIQCPRDWADIRSYYNMPVQMKRPGGGIYWMNDTIPGTICLCCHFL